MKKEYKGWKVTYDVSKGTVEATKTTTKLGRFVKKHMKIKITMLEPTTNFLLEKEIREEIDEEEQ